MTGIEQTPDFIPAEVEERISRGINPYWHEHIRKVATKVIEKVLKSRQQLEVATLPSETADDAINRVEGEKFLELITADIIVKEHEDDGDLGLEDLIVRETAECEEVRRKILTEGFYDSSQVLDMLTIDKMELIRLIDRGSFVVVTDHDDLIFPSFQFSSPEARSLVERIEGARLKYQTPDPGAIRIPEIFRPYPSWDRTTWWFGMYDEKFMKDEPIGQRPVDLILNGRIQELADRLDVTLN